MTTALVKSQANTILDLASKYNYDEKHAAFVERAALLLFDALKSIHKLGEDERALLSHASLLHDIGNYINSKKHSKYSMFIIDNDEKLDGYPGKERKLLSLIVYNHRKKIHKGISLLTKKERDIVLKLSALLRVADSMDYTRKDYIIKDADLKKDQVQITVDGVHPGRLSKRLTQKKPLFNEVFKLEIKVRGHTL